jgi:hypothetical protein
MEKAMTTRNSPKVVYLGLLLILVAASTSAIAQSPLEARIVRVVYEIIPLRGATWGFHLAHMRDGRHCVRLGNPGRLALAVIERVADLCFDKIPGSVDKTGVRTSQAFDTKNQPITISTYHKGSIEASGNAIILLVTTCNKATGGEDYRCSPQPFRFVVHMEGAGCVAEVTLAYPNQRAEKTTCEHYAAK